MMIIRPQGQFTLDQGVHAPIILICIGRESVRERDGEREGCVLSERTTCVGRVREKREILTRIKTINERDFGLVWITTNAYHTK
jgi:hypothetical protein